MKLQIKKLPLFSLLSLVPALVQNQSEEELSCQCAMGTSAFHRRGNLITSPRDLPWEFPVWNGALNSATPWVNAVVQSSLFLSRVREAAAFHGNFSWISALDQPCGSGWMQQHFSAEGKSLISHRKSTDPSRRSWFPSHTLFLSLETIRAGQEIFVTGYSADKWNR